MKTRTKPAAKVPAPPRQVAWWSLDGGYTMADCPYGLADLLARKAAPVSFRQYYKQISEIYAENGAYLFAWKCPASGHCVVRVMQSSDVLSGFGWSGTVLVICVAAADWPAFVVEKMPGLSTLVQNTGRQSRGRG
jgi:hypothetical protein